MRTRSTTTGNLNDFTATVFETNPSTGVTTPYSSSYFGKREVKTIQDVVTSGFFGLKRCGKFLPINPVDIQTANEDRVPGSVSATNDLSGFTYSGNFWFAESPVLVLPSPDDALIEAATLAAAANAAAAEWDVLTFLAEFSKSASLMYDIGSRFNNATLRMAKAARSFKRNPWNRFRELWLEARYGVRPIIYDFNSAYKSFLTYKDELTVIRGTGFQREDSDDFHDSGWTPYSFYYEKRQTEELSSKLTYHGSAYVEYAGSLSTRSQSFGFDPLTTAWELVPYSFVVDWFINIGSYVQTIRPQLSGSLLGVGSSWKQTWTRTRRYSLRGISPRASGSWGPSITEEKVEHYVRFPSGVPLPGVLPNLTLPKVLDLFALFVGGRNRVMSTLNR